MTDPTPEERVRFPYRPEQARFWPLCSDWAGESNNDRKADLVAEILKLLKGWCERHIREAEQARERAVRQECIHAIREACENCEGTGIQPGSEQYNEFGRAIGDECEYCGRPIQAIEAIRARAQQEDGTG